MIVASGLDRILARGRHHETPALPSRPEADSVTQRLDGEARIRQSGESPS